MTPGSWSAETRARGRRSGLRIGVALATLSLAACKEPRTGSGASGAPSAAAHPPSAAVIAFRDGPPGKTEAWVDAVRAGDYGEALRRLDAAKNGDSEAPEVRYARARCLMAGGEHERARTLLENLGKELPALSEEIGRDTAECALVAGPFDRAAAYFGTRGDAESLLKAALANERAGKLPSARSLLDRALRAAGSGSDAIVVRVRAARARICAALGDAKSASADLRWLALEAPATAEGHDAEKQLAEKNPRIAYTADERLSRARKFAESGKLDEALAELAAIAPGAAPPNVLLRARAQAHYLSRTSYDEAARLYDEAAQKGGPEAAHDAFYAARALARAQKDDLAVPKYEALVGKYPSSEYAEEAKYQAARLRLMLGRFDEAAAAYERYLVAYGSRGAARFRAVAKREFGLALLSSKRPVEAAKTFHTLAALEDDPIDRSALLELEGAALAEAGERPAAVARLGELVRGSPLGFAGMLAAARLAALGETVPRLDPSPLGSELEKRFSIDLPENAAVLARLGFVEDAERALRAHEPEIVLRYAPRGYEALCEAYGRIGAGAARYRVGRAAVKTETFEQLPTDETRWAFRCVYPEPFQEIVRAAEERRNLPRGLLYAVMRQESAFAPDAVSPANAVGLLQLMPSTAERAAQEMGVLLLPELLRVPSRNVELGAYYLRRVLDTFGGHVALAAAAYNAGPRAVSRWLETGEDLPLDVWVARIPFAETRGYVMRVVGNLARYAYLNGGGAAVPKLALALPKGLRAKDGDY